MKRYIFYKTTADFDNTGEVLIYRSLLNYLRKYGSVILNDADSISPVFLKRIGINEKERLSSNSPHPFMLAIFIFAFKCLFTGDKVYFVTGVGEHHVSGKKDILKNVISFFFLGFLKLLCVNIVRIGMSMRFGGKGEAMSEKLLSSVFDSYYVRDSLSKYYCNTANITKCGLAPDLSWGYNCDYSGTNNPQQFVFSFRAFCESESNQEIYVEKLKLSIRQMIDHILALSNQTKILFTYQVDKDFGFMKLIYDEFYTSTPQISFIDKLLTLDNAKDYYGVSSVIFSNRLHVLLLGYKYGAMTICLTDVVKHVKIKGIFDDCNLSHNLLDINSAIDERTSKFELLRKETLSNVRSMRRVEKANQVTLNVIMDSIFKI